MVTSLMLAAQAHSAHAFVLSKSNSETPVVFSSNTTLLVSTAVNSNISPTSVSSSASNFIYPAVSGRCQFVNDFIVDTETSVLAYSPVSTDLSVYVRLLSHARHRRRADEPRGFEPHRGVEGGRSGAVTGRQRGVQ